MKKRIQIYILSLIVILVGGILILYPELIRNIKYRIFPPKTYQECVIAGGRETLGEPNIADDERCEINGKEFSPWDFLRSETN